MINLPPTLTFIGVDKGAQIEVDHSTSSDLYKKAAQITILSTYVDTLIEEVTSCLSCELILYRTSSVLGAS